MLVITGNATNCIANYKLARYAPVVNVDAQSFFHGGFRQRRKFNPGRKGGGQSIGSQVKKS